MPEPSRAARLLATDSITGPLDHEPAEQVVRGSPTTGVRVLGEVGGVEVGVWEITAGTVRDTEVDEIFVVLSGAGRVYFEDGDCIDLSPGVAVRLLAGERTTWTITSTLRKVWIA
ncbi:MAG: cupin domain-containing protein [Dermatophilaceae bacterium]